MTKLNHSLTIAISLRANQLAEPKPRIREGAPLLFELRRGKLACLAEAAEAAKAGGPAWIRTRIIERCTVLASTLSATGPTG